MNATPIEDRALWSIHRAAADKARASGMCWWCAQLVGFAATDNPPSTPELRACCQKRKAAT